MLYVLYIAAELEQADDMQASGNANLDADIDSKEHNIA